MTDALIRPQFRRLSLPKRLLVIGFTSSLLALMGGPIQRTTGEWMLAPSAAIAQTSITDEEVTQYARAVLQMDAHRSEAYTRVKDLLLTVDMSVSDVSMSCTNPRRDLSQVPRSIRSEVEEVLVTYCNQAREIVAENGLTANRFNEITAAHQEDDALAERIRRTLIQLQQP